MFFENEETKEKEENEEIFIFCLRRIKCIQIVSRRIERREKRARGKVWESDSLSVVVCTRGCLSLAVHTRVYTWEREEGGRICTHGHPVQQRAAPSRESTNG